MTTPPQPPNQPPGQPPGGGGFGPPSAGGFGQPQNGGFGQPQNGGFGQPQSGGFGGPGFPGPYGSPPPPSPNRNNKVVGIVVAAVLVVALAVAGTLLAVSGGDDGKNDSADKKARSEQSDSPSDEPSDEPSEDDEPTPSPSESKTAYELKFPKTLENGQYRLRKDLSDSVDTSNPGEEAHLGSYANSSDTSRLLYGAASGEDYGNPEFSKNQMMNGMESGSAMDVAVKRRDITPAGDDPLTCEVLVKTQAGRKLTIPVCAWSDPGTAAYVAKDSADTYSVPPKDVDLEAWADRVSDIRDEVRVPKD
ncbi:hypothetical protein ITI46_29910 [Streptomyces oryzae]|uniref:Aromatic ring-opening dioxygenase LigA n=1 Tax=Streptomyces oryzae TaxID=1434886 RepID=A0ABS3XKI0_9ACTN|nr:hypothetical protein [Streptomyces oryzae]MBO8195833.1 hypothetical protein [Streptomyces oryzae]